MITEVSYYHSIKHHTFDSNKKISASGLNIQNSSVQIHQRPTPISKGKQALLSGNIFTAWTMQWLNNSRRNVDSLKEHPIHIGCWVFGNRVDKIHQTTHSSINVWTMQIPQKDLSENHPCGRKKYQHIYHCLVPLEHISMGECETHTL